MVGGLAFAASVMVMVGSFSIVAGIAAIFDDGYIVVSRRYAFDLDTTAWGWIHLVLGIAIVVTGFSLFANQGLGWDRRARALRGECDRPLLLHSLRAVLVDPHHRAQRLGHLGADPGPQDPRLTAPAFTPGCSRGTAWRPGRCGSGR